MEVKRFYIIIDMLILYFDKFGKYNKMVNRPEVIRNTQNKTRFVLRRSRISRKINMFVLGGVVLSHFEAHSKWRSDDVISETVNIN